jgi:hypothetical protein
LPPSNQIMRVLSVVLLLLFPLILLSQKKASRLVPAQRKMPGKDSIMIIENLMAGGSKHYTWNSSNLYLALSANDSKCRKINISYNNRNVLSGSCLLKAPKSLSLRLTKKVNMLLISQAGGNEVDSFAANMILKDGALIYNITTQVKKGKKDTIFIRHNN